MTPKTTDWIAIRDWTIELTQNAATQAAELLRQDVDIQRKADGTVVTNIDKMIEQFLRDAISSRFPDHAILGEEYGFAPRADNAPLWAIDPIDGTVNLANGLPHWGVSVALIADSDPVVGVVSCPLLRETFAAAKGAGVTLNGKPLPLLSPGGETTWDDVYAICSVSVRDVDFARLAARLRIHGSAALELCWVAAGRVVGAQSIGTSLYDVAAGILIAREVGSETGWLSGEDWSALEMAAKGPRKDDILLTATPATVSFLRQRIAFRTMQEKSNL